MALPLSATVVRLNLKPVAPSAEHPRPVDMPTAVSPAYRRTLRTALAMRGGVSLAVWIGGAVAELDVFRRIRLVRNDTDEVEAYFAFTPSAASYSPEERALLRRADTYAQVLMAQGFDAVEFDILAGASAGGLNGVLYSVAQRAGSSVDPMEEVWKNAGDIWSLMQPPGFRSVDSGLRADEYFWPEVRRALNGFHTSATRNLNHRARRVTLDLSATITDGGDLNDGDSRQGYGHFHFVGADAGENEGLARSVPPAETLGRDIPATVAKNDDPALARLAYASRTTSAFPGAFEPALIASHAVDSSADLDLKRVDLSYAFSAHRPKNVSAFHVVDGGVKDNIPIDRAFRSIRQTPLDDFSTRALIYLNPSPEEADSLVEPPTQPQHAPKVRPLKGKSQKQKPREDPLSHFLRATITSLKKFALRESGEQEIQAVQDFRRGMLSARGRAVIAAQPMRSGAVAFDDELSQAAIDDYVLYRASADLAMLDDILQHPALWQLGTNLTVRRLRTAADEETRAFVETRIFDLYTGGLDPAGPVQVAITEGPQALHDAARAASAWLRFLEESLFFVEPPAVRQHAPEFDSARALIAEVARRARYAREQRIDHVLRSLTDESVEPGAESVAHEIVNRWTEPDLTIADVWVSELDHAVTELQAITTALHKSELIEVNIDHSIWGKIPRAIGFGARDLAPFISGSGIPEPLSDLRFRAISAGERPSPDIPFTALREHRQVVRAQQAMRAAKAPTVSRSLSDPLTAESKLAGLSLFSFGGFLSTEWRQHDWWWGRMDASAGMLRFFGELEAVPGTTTALTPESAVSQAQEQILRTATSEFDGTIDDAARKFASRAPMLGDLRREYLGAVASRLLRVVSRAVSRTSYGSAGWRKVAVALVRPIAVLAPLALNPQRAILAAAVVLSTLVVLSPGEIDSPTFHDSQFRQWPGVLVGVVAAVVVLAGFGAVVGAVGRGQARWRKVAPLVAGIKVRAPGGVQLVGAVLVAFVAVATLVVDVFVRELLTGVEFWSLALIALVLLGVASRSARRITEQATVFPWASLVSALIAVGLVATAEFIARSGGLAPHPVIVVGVGATALTATLFYGWKTGIAPRGVKGESPAKVRRRVGRSFAAWLLLSLGCGFFTALVCTLVLLPVSLGWLPPSDPTIVTLATLSTLFVWGTLTWWAGEIPTSYAPRDDTVRR